MEVGCFRDSQSQLFFYRMEAPLSMGTHLPCCVIVAHNGAHLIQAVQGFFLKPISPFTAKQVMF